MEFGLFIQGYNPAVRREGDPEAEHRAFMDELAAVIAADQAGFKYVWVTEHHFLDEYSHLSANDVVLSYLAAKTERIHLGSGIYEILGFLPGIESTDVTREIWEDVIGEFAKMWMQDTYQGYDGKYWS